jgi:ketosteroid isomerase-like protein
VALQAIAGLSPFPLDPLERDLRTLVEAERSFAALSLSAGADSAFLTYLSDDAVVLRPHPVNGRSWIRSNPGPPITLWWTPAYACVSAGGDLGYTSGPWTVTNRQQSERPPRHGEYVSIWKRTSGGRWRVIFDIGISHALPQPPVFDTLLYQSPECNGSFVRQGMKSRQQAEAEVRRTDSLFSHEAREAGYAMAMQSALSPSARVYRNGHRPAVVRDSCLALVRATAMREQWQPIGVTAALTGDLAFSYGSYVAGTSEGKERKGYYVRIWRDAGANEGWKIVLDIETRLPSE